MLKFDKSVETNTFSVYPEVSSSYASSISGSYFINLTQDYDRSETTVSATLLNNPTTFNPRLILQVQTVDIPSYSGLYSVVIKEGITSERPKWGTTNEIWSLYHRIWSDSGSAPVDVRTLDNDRAYVSGSDIPSFITYTTSGSEYIYESGSVINPPTQYVSPDENGTYITYHT